MKADVCILIFMFKPLAIDKDILWKISFSNKTFTLKLFFVSIEILEVSLLILQQYFILYSSYL